MRRWCWIPCWLPLAACYASAPSAQDWTRTTDDLPGTLDGGEESTPVAEDGDYSELVDDAPHLPDTGGDMPDSGPDTPIDARSDSADASAPDLPDDAADEEADDGAGDADGDAFLPCFDWVPHIYVCEPTIPVWRCEYAFDEESCMAACGHYYLPYTHPFYNPDPFCACLTIDGGMPCAWGGECESGQCNVTYWPGCGPCRCDGRPCGYCDFYRPPNSGCYCLDPTSDSHECT